MPALNARSQPAATKGRRGGRLPRAVVEQRLEDFLEIALVEFARAGFGATSLDHLVKLSGVSKTTIFRKYGNKEGMLRTLIEKHVTTIVAELRAVPLDSDDPLGTITRFVTSYTDVAVRSQLGHALLNIILLERNALPSLNQMLVENTYEGFQPISDYIAVLMSRGVLAAGDPREAAFDLQALITQGFRVMVDKPDYLLVPDRAQHIARRFLKGWS